MLKHFAFRVFCVFHKGQTLRHPTLYNYVTVVSERCVVAVVLTTAH